MMKPLIYTLLCCTSLSASSLYAAATDSSSGSEFSVETLPPMDASPLYPEEIQKALEGSKLEKDDVSLFKDIDNTPDVTTIREALEMTYMQNSQLDSARAALRATDENVAIAVSGWRPSASIQFQQTQRWSLPSGPGPVPLPGGRVRQGKRPNTHNYDSNFQLSGEQNVFAGGGTYAQTEAAKERVYAGRYGLLSTEQEVLTEATQSFLDVITNEAIAELRKSSENFLLKTWEQTQVRYEVGEVTRTEVEAAKSSYLGARAQRIAAEGAVESSRAGYERVVGSPAGKLGKAEIIANLPNNLEEAKQLSLSNNPSILQASRNIEAAEYDVNSQIAPLLPSVDVSANIGRNRLGGSGVALGPQRQTNAQFLTTVNVPLYRKGESRARIRQAHQQVGQSKVDLVTAKRNTLAATTRAWEDLEASRSTVESLIAQVQASKLAVEGVSEEAAVGTKNVLDVLEQEENLVNSQINLVQSESRLVLASYQVLAAIGRLTALDLNFNVKHYDPKEYYDEHSGALFKSWKGEDHRYVKDQNEDDS